VFVPHKKHIYWPPRLVKGITSFLYLTGITYGSPKPVTGIIYFLYVDDARISQETLLETLLRASKAY
jgi:hypothetical protein